MKAMSDYPKSLAPNDNTAYGTFKDETQPGTGDGTEIKAAQMQDLYYALYQVLSLAGTTPNNDLENSTDNKQFLASLAQISWLKYDSSLSYSKGAIVLYAINESTIAYRSLVNNNVFPLSDSSAWKEVFNIDANHNFNIAGGGSSNSLPVGTILTIYRTDTPTGFLRLNGSEYPRTLFQEFYDNYLDTKLIPTINYDQYNTQYNNNAGNVGYFGIDPSTQSFKVPILQDMSFIAQANTIDAIARFSWDTLQGHKIQMTTAGTVSDGWGSSPGFNRGRNDVGPITLKDTKVISDDVHGNPRISDRTQSRHICYPYVIYVGE